MGLVKDHVSHALPCELFARSKLSLLCPQTIPTCRAYVLLSLCFWASSFFLIPEFMLFLFIQVFGLTNNHD